MVSTVFAAHLRTCFLTLAFLDAGYTSGGTVRIVRRFACVALVLRAVSAGAQGSIAGTVYDSLRSHAPLANATVVLVERDRYATTDAQGHFRIDSVPDGHYTLGFMHAVLDSLDLELPVVPVDVAGGHGADVALFTPSPATAYARICPGPRDPDSGVIIGRVRDVDNRTPLKDATVSTDWTEFTLTGGHAGRHKVSAATKTNAGGVYLLCGVPADVPLDVHSDVDGFIAGPTPLQLNDRLISRLDFAVSRRDSAARGVLRTDSFAVTVAGSPGTASLRGVLIGIDGHPVRDAVVGVAGTQRTARTDSTGTFRINNIPAGTRTIEVRSIGKSPTTFSLELATNAVRDTTFSLARQMQELKPVAVEGTARSMSLMLADGFEKRREQALGSFTTEQDIAKHNFPDLVSILRGTRGIHVECNANKHLLQGVSCTPIPMMMSVSDFNNARCVPNLFLDGVQFHDGIASLAAIATPTVIRGIEVYDTSGGIPPQYDLTSTTGCGSIVVWTR
jgi:hypothetical protein